VLWAMEVTTGVNGSVLTDGLNDGDEWVRAWTVELGRRTLATGAPISKTPPDIFTMARSDPSPVVRLALASVAQTASGQVPRFLTSELLRHSEDAADHNLPSMYWFAMEPLCTSAPKDMLNLALETTIPRILNFTTRRIASLGTAEAR